MTDLEDVEFLPPDKKTTANAALIRKAFREGFKEGIAFMNESDSMHDAHWKKQAFKDFCKKNKIKL